MVDDGLPPPRRRAADEVVALAWALKDLCYEAWSSAPQRSARAAEAMRALCPRDLARRLAQDQAWSAAAREVQALADWTLAIAHLTRGEMAAATEALDRAEAAFLALGQPEHAAQTQVPKIMALAMLGRHDAAVACAERAEQLFVAQRDGRAAGKVALNLGSMHLRRDRHREAAAHYRRAAVRFARVGDHELSIMADIGIADACASMGDFDEALRLYARARMRSRSHALPVLEAKTDESVALLELARGRYREALACLERTRRAHEALAMPQNLAIDEKQLADAYLEVRLLPEALDLYDRAVAQFEALQMPDDLAWALLQRGRTLAWMGDGAGAARSLARAEAVFDAQALAAGQAAVRLAGAELALAAGQAGPAGEMAARALAGFEEAGLAEAGLRARLVAAQALVAGGATAAGLAQLDALLEQARAQGALALQVRAQAARGHALRALGRTGEAAAAFEQAIEGFEIQRRALPGDELRSAFLGDHLGPYQARLEMALARHDQAPEGAAGDVLLQLERFRARTLSERLAQGAAAPADDATRAQRERLNWLYRRLHQAEVDGEPGGPWAEEARRVERDLLEAARRARLADADRPPAAPGAGDAEARATRAASNAAAGAPDAQAARDEAAALPAELRRHLGEHAALVEYGVAGDELFACVVTAGAVRVVRHMAGWADVLATLRATQFQIDALRHGVAAMRAHLPVLTTRARQRLQALHALVWAPLAGALADARRVLVVPHAPLGALPFAALHDGHAHLGERLDLALAGSARLALRGLQRPAVAPARVLALGESSRLPHAAREAEAVARLLPHGTAHIGAEASLATLARHAGEADVLHLACHGQFRGDNPMFSALHLADGAVTVEWAERLALRPGIAVLSACETSVSQAGGGDEAVGLVRAFLVAGAARVLATLWPVDDEVTAGFMQAFYGALARGEAPARALGCARREVMRSHPHPYFWSGFVLHGGW